MDKITKEQRSYTMSRIKGKNTKPEQMVFQGLKLLGVRFRKHYKLLGNPDVVFPKAKVAVFIDGDFWHGWVYKQRKDKLPEYWVTKIKRNMNRDRRYRNQLKKEGWTVIGLWEHSILKDVDKAIKKALKAVT